MSAGHFWCQYGSDLNAKGGCSIKLFQWCTIEYGVIDYGRVRYVQMVSSRESSSKLRWITVVLITSCATGYVNFGVR